MTSRQGRSRPPPVDGKKQHENWLSLVDITGPFLSMPVLLRTWKTLDPLDDGLWTRLRQEHTAWQRYPDEIHAWARFVLAELLGWGDALRHDLPDEWSEPIAEHDTTIRPSFALTDPESGKPRLFGLTLPPSQAPAARIPGEAWAASPVDRLARLCRKHDVPLGLAVDGRWWALVWAPPDGVTGCAIFDAATWSDATDHYVVRAFISLLRRSRFFGVPDAEMLPALLTVSQDVQEEITEALGVQVRRAVELLVEAIGRADVRAREAGDIGLSDVDAKEAYRAAVTVMMRVVFLLFAEERSLLPADNDLYRQSYSVGLLCAELEKRAQTDSEDELEHSNAAWHRLQALSNALHAGVDHLVLTLPAYDGPLFNPSRYPWLNEVTVDDRTVLHMLLAVQYVETGTGRNRERRRLTFRALDVEQIGYVYEGLMSFEGFRAVGPVLGLIGKQGEEQEIELAELERLAKGRATAQLAELLAKKFKSSKIGTPRSLEQKLAPLSDMAQAEAMRKLLAATDNNHEVAERALPFVGILRSDLRDLPMVINDGGLYVTESRAYTGAHYTPRFLAEKVAEGALEPLVYSPGPLQTDDTSKWKLRSSKEILGLRVVDITMGSGAFLVAACRYLATMLVEAWTQEDSLPEIAGPVDVTNAESDPLILKARQEIIEHCLYGVDVNPMSVDVAMAKLSLWLVSTGKSGPFTFLEDKFVVGDSLLGITTLDQLEVLHMDPERGKEIHELSLFDLTAPARAVAAEIAENRRAVVEANDHETKSRLLEKAKHLIQQARPLADLTVGAALAHATNPDKGSLRAASLLRRISDGVQGAEHAAREQAKRWLNIDKPDGGLDRVPAHWPLEFADIFDSDQGGFDAVIGNPPFLGGKKITGAVGTAYREYLINVIGRGARGNADLIAYFVLRAHDLLNSMGQTGLVATNTLAQGETREVGLDQLVRMGAEIRQAIKSDPWPSKSAILEYCAVWTSRPRVASGRRQLLERRGSTGWIATPVEGITSTLDLKSRVDNNPNRLAENRGIAFQGSTILGSGFIVDPKRAMELIQKDLHNREVLFPYLNGEDLNSRPDCSARRWVINFGALDKWKAQRYVDCFQQVESNVKPARQRAGAAVRTYDWWRYWRPRRELYRAITSLRRVLAMTRVSKVVMPVMVPTGQVFSDALVIFSSGDTAMLAMLSSSPHYWWAISRASTMKSDLRYTPTDVFETFPKPRFTSDMRILGEHLIKVRRDLMIDRPLGLTGTYNLVHNPSCQDTDIAELRAIHQEIDYMMARAYEWNDLADAGLGHYFYPTRQGIRYTLAPVVRQEILDRLLELNQERYRQEKSRGLHDKPRHRIRTPTDDNASLFSQPDDLAEL